MTKENLLCLRNNLNGTSVSCWWTDKKQCFWSMDHGVKTMTHWKRCQCSHCSCTRGNAWHKRFFVHVHANDDKAWLGQVGIGNPDSEQTGENNLHDCWLCEGNDVCQHAQMMWMVWRMYRASRPHKRNHGCDPGGFKRSAEDWSAERDDSVISYKEVPIEWITEDFDITCDNVTDKKLSPSQIQGASDEPSSCQAVFGKMRARLQSERNLWHQQARQTLGSNPVMIGADGVHDSSTWSRSTSWQRAQCNNLVQTGVDSGEQNDDEKTGSQDVQVHNQEKQWSTPPIRFLLLLRERPGICGFLLNSMKGITDTTANLMAIVMNTL